MGTSTGLSTCRSSELALQNLFLLRPSKVQSHHLWLAVGFQLTPGKSKVAVTVGTSQCSSYKTHSPVQKTSTNAWALSKTRRETGKHSLQKLLKNLDGTFETCKLHVGKDQTTKPEKLVLWSGCFTKHLKQPMLGAKMLNTSEGLLTSSPMTNRNPGMKTSTHLQSSCPLPKKLPGSPPSGTLSHVQSTRSTKMLLWTSFSTTPRTQLTGWSGVFDTLRPAASKNVRETMRSFSAGTWNARSFFCRDQTLFGKKLKYLHKQIKLFDVFCMQEVRGSEALVNKHLRLIMRTHWIF